MPSISSTGVEAPREERRPQAGNSARRSRPREKKKNKKKNCY